MMRSIGYITGNSPVTASLKMRLSRGSIRRKWRTFIRGETHENRKMDSLDRAIERCKGSGRSSEKDNRGEATTLKLIDAFLYACHR